jgi:hypothetical protein
MPLPTGDPRAPIVAPRPASRPLTVWESMTASDGSSSRPAAVRTARRRASRMAGQVPSAVHRVRSSWAVGRLAKSFGSMAHWHPALAR